MKSNKLLILFIIVFIMFGCMSINTFAVNKDINQTYNSIKLNNQNTIDNNIIKLEWTINDIQITYNSHKTWDPDTLDWIETKENINISGNTAIFKLTNYSNDYVVANVAFVVEESLKDTYNSLSVNNNDCTVKTPYTLDSTLTYTESEYEALAQTITSSINFNEDKFTDLTDTTSPTKYGTYTVKIQEPSLKLTVLSWISNVITFKEIIALGYGEVEYAMNLTNTAPTTGWQTSTTFNIPDMQSGVSYYFFARFSGDDTHEPSLISSCSLSYSTIPTSNKKY